MGRIRKPVPRKGPPKQNKLENPSSDEHESSSDHEEEPASSFMKECQHVFSTTDLYAILNLEKEKATLNDSK